MEIEVLPVIMALAGFILLYGAVKNLNPLEVVKLSLQGKDPSKASPIFVPSGDPQNLTAGPGATPGGSIDPGQFNRRPDGTYDDYDPGFDPDRDDVLPILPGEYGSGGGAV